ncbi:hypothetical protein GH714_042024 [Hevea brasiliensis]|uniref:Uncharacterized protein n=1 Tax=Hevea brasiliensis TaxID=3981 RepID=A0A6A6MWX8_HEVBR|nr:hypothetical protein GH714_042024 [Hevea brasiliensis]
MRIEVYSPVPFGLYKLTVLLVKEEFIDLDSILGRIEGVKFLICCDCELRTHRYAHLLPRDDEAFEHHKAFSSKQLDEVYSYNEVILLSTFSIMLIDFASMGFPIPFLQPNKTGKINLAATGMDLMDDDKQRDVAIELFAAFDMETEAVAERSSELESSQTLGLLAGFLLVDDWYHAHILFDHLCSSNLVARVQICGALFRPVEKSVSAAYDIIRQMHLQNFGSSSRTGIDSKDTISSLGHRSFVDLLQELFQMLVTIGPYLYRDIILLQKQEHQDQWRIKSKWKNQQIEYQMKSQAELPQRTLQNLRRLQIWKAVGRTPSTSSGDKDIPSYLLEGRQGNVPNNSSAITPNGNAVSTPARGLTSSARTSDGHGGKLKVDSGAAKSVVKDYVTKGGDIQKQPPRLIHSPRHDSSLVATKYSDKLQRRTSPAEDPDRLSKRWKVDSELRDLEGEVRFSDRESSMDARLVDLDKTGTDEQKHPDKSRGDDILLERSTERSMERYGRERSVERGQERGADRNFDRPSDKAKDERNKDDRSKLRYGDTSMVKSHDDDRFYGKNLPPPPPLPLHVVHQSVNSGRRDEDADGSFGTTRHTQRLSPRHEEKER